MKTITAHRKRVGDLKKLFQDVLSLEVRLLNGRYESYSLQMAGDDDRATDLDALDERLDMIETELEYMRDALATFSKPPVSLASEPPPAP